VRGNEPGERALKQIEQSSTVSVNDMELGSNAIDLFDFNMNFLFKFGEIQCYSFQFLKWTTQLNENI
jgi:hypothetical protein